MRIGMEKRSVMRSLLVGVLLLGSFGVAYAVSEYLSDFNTRYGTAGTALDTCTTCHTSPPNLNGYGTAFLDSGLNFAAIEGLDSDGDGYTNLIEINARTFPGNGTSHPAGDAAAPIMTAFSIPPTTTSLTITITTLTATDNVAVTGYLITESSTRPLASVSGWSASPPTTYTVTSAGSKSLYAWAKDATGNVSNFLLASTFITLADAIAPQVTAFSIPSAATSLTVSVTALTASDDVAVTGYLITESSTKPAASASGWSVSPPTGYTFTSAGAKTLYAWAKDGAGNVSNSLIALTMITINDANLPQITAFSVPATGSSLIIPITAFTATDDVGVAGYLITETASAPLASASGWSASPPTSYTFASGGTKTLYAWAKDGTGNVSASASASTIVTLTDTVPPQVTAFSVPSTGSALVISITTFTASDNTGVTGYLITEATTPPMADPSAGWSPSPPASYTFASAGSKTLHAWAKDAAGNVSAPVTASTTVDLSDDDGGGSSNCFVATAAFGSYLDPYVRILRNFRDAFLLTNVGGKAFVAWYYRNSPPLADAIAQRSVARAVVRAGLLPLVGFSVVALKIGLWPALLAILLCLTGIGLGAHRIYALKRTAGPAR